MTSRFTVHEARPIPEARPKVPAPAKPAKTESPGADGPGANGKAKETGGPSGPEPTRYGDWERSGICVDF